MQPLIWNKPPIWNTFAADRVVFHIRYQFRIGGTDLMKIWYLTNNIVKVKNKVSKIILI